MLKRAHKGTFHKLSPKHLQRYSVKAATASSAVSRSTSRTCRPTTSTRGPKVERRRPRTVRCSANPATAENRTSEATVKKPDAKPVYKANYGEATPEQVALALLRHRPDAPEAVKRRLPTQPRESPFWHRTKAQPPATASDHSGSAIGSSGRCATVEGFPVPGTFLVQGVNRLIQRTVTLSVVTTQPSISHELLRFRSFRNHF